LERYFEGTGAYLRPPWQCAAGKAATVAHNPGMSSSPAEPVSIELDTDDRVSGLIQRPSRAIACFVFAHGAGAGMQHPFMTAVASDLAARGIATLRYQFPYMERKSRRPDSPAVCDAAVRAAVACASRKMPQTPLIAGGKSFGGRMTSQAQAASPLPDVRGLAFLGFPLHPPNRPADDRAAHLSQVHIPMLFMQGARDEFADLGLLEPVIARLGVRATLQLMEGADHSFHVPARSGRTDEQVRAAMLDAFAAWVRATI
jgi:predicted alpha/beta-hydrolase family hydrolase